MGIDKVSDLVAKLDKYVSRNSLPQSTEHKVLVDALPKPLHDLAIAVANSYGFPIEFLVSAMLHAASTAIGNSRQLDFIWREAAVLYMLFIGPPGSNKSNAIKFVYKPIYDRESVDDTGDLSQSVVIPKTVTTDTTIEGLIDLLAKNSRGVAIVSDEIVQVLRKPSAVAHLLSLFSRTPISKVRKSTTYKTNREPFVNLIGTLQTNIMEDTLKKGNAYENEFLERALITVSETEHRHLWTTQQPDKKLYEVWDNTILQLLKLKEERDAQGDLMPASIVTYSQAALSTIISYRNHLVRPSFDLDENIVARIYAKRDNHLLRLSLVLHCLDNVCNGSENFEISRETAERAIALTDFYMEQAFGLWERLSRKNPLDIISQTKLLIYRQLPHNFSTTEALAIAHAERMPERTLKYWLKSDRRLFKTHRTWIL